MFKLIKVILFCGNYTDSEISIVLLVSISLSVCGLYASVYAQEYLSGISKHTSFMYISLYTNYTVETWERSPLGQKCWLLYSGDMQVCSDPVMY